MKTTKRSARVILDIVTDDYYGVNTEVDYTHDEAKRVLSVMQRYRIDTYSEAAHMLTMLGLEVAGR